MEATQILRRMIAMLLLLSLASEANAANFRTRNFIIQAPTPGLARTVGESAERYRHDLAEYWLGKPLPAWPTPCPIRVIAGPRLAAQGVTTYNRAPVRDFQMEVVGTPERILDSVLPHEVTHTILASYFGRPLPRWADEGICTTVEHESERRKHEMKLREFLHSRRGIAMNKLFLLTEYPADVLPMYAQGYSVCSFLIEQKGPRTFIAFLRDYMARPSWTENVKKHYQYDSLAELQEYWLAWVSAGSGPVEKFAKVQPRTSNPNTPDSAAVAQASLQSNAGSGIANPANPVRPAAALALRDARGNAVKPPAQTPDAVALASTSEGWYQRRAHQAKGQSKPSSVSGATLSAMVPPSVRNSGSYSAAQPQPEQQMSRAGAPVRMSQLDAAATYQR